MTVFNPSHSGGSLRLLTGAMLAACLAACTTNGPNASGQTIVNPVVTAATTDRDGCEHLEQGPATAVTASATDTVGPLVSKAHTRFDISLPGGAATAYVRYASSKAGDYVIYMSKAVPLTVTDDTRKVVTPVSSAAASTACGDIKARQQVTLGVGTYYIALGPSAETSLSLVAIATDDAGDGK